jgi:hypothetical protein
VDVWIHIFLILAIAGGEWSASRSSHFTPEEEPLVPSIGWVGPRSDLDNEKRKILILPGLGTLDSTVAHPMASCYTNCTILAVKYLVLWPDPCVPQNKNLVNDPGNDESIDIYNTAQLSCGN